MTGQQRIIIFSDLDGTLLDHGDYSWQAALPALEKLKKQEIPLVLASSKTAAEMAPMRAALGFDHCEAIVENGAGVLPPQVSQPTAQRSHDGLLAVLAAMPEALRSGFSGFSDWSVEEVSRRTGLDLAASERAKMRDFSEPGLWSGSDAQLQEFLQALEAKSLFAQQGGRFLTLSFGASKADRLREIVSLYENRWDGPVESFALGDAANDVAMLEAASRGAIIPNPAHGGIGPMQGENDGRIIRATMAGPAGWNESVLSFLANRVMTKTEVKKET